MNQIGLVIIGSGPAGTAAADFVRKQSAMSVTVVSDEGLQFYVREHLARFLSGRDTEDALFERGRNHCETIGAAFIAGKVARVDPREKSVSFADGSVIKYGDLLVASGGKPRELDVDGANLDGVSTCYTLEAARGLKQSLDSARRVTIVGGGTIAAKLIPFLHERSTEVTVVERSPMLLSNVLDRGASSVVKRALVDNGVRVIENGEITEFIGEKGKIRHVQLRSGDPIPCDTAIVAVGIRPSVGFLNKAGVKIDRGVVVDAGLRSTAGHIFAAGDAAQAPDPLHGGAPTVHSGWKKALAQGEAAAKSILNREPGYSGSINSEHLQILDLGVAAVGITATSNVVREVVESSVEKRFYRKFTFDDTGLTGAILVEKDLPRKELRSALERLLLQKKRPSLGSVSEYEGLLRLPAHALVNRLVEMQGL